MNSGDVISFSGTNTDSIIINSTYGYYFQMTGSFNVEGNIASIYNNNDSFMTSACYLALFSGCTNLVDASKLILPATTTAPSCYAYMFYHCSNLISCPSTLPASFAAPSCYYAMFNGCTSLTAAPNIEATTLSSSSCQTMFGGDTALVKGPIISATDVSANYCMGYMFYGCTSLTSITVAFTTWGKTNSWVEEVNTSNGVFIKPSALSAEYGGSRIPTGWNVLDTVYEPLTFIATDDNQAVALNKVGSPTETVMKYSKNDGAWTNYSYNDIIPMASGDTVAFLGANNGNFSLSTSSNSYRFVTTGQIHTKGSVMSLLNFRTSVPQYAFLSLFSGASIVNPPLLPATKLAQYCYYGMFRNNSVLTSTP
jgi:hypothetical protein